MGEGNGISAYLPCSWSKAPLWWWGLISLSLLYLLTVYFTKCLILYWTLGGSSEHRCSLLSFWSLQSGSLGNCWLMETVHYRVFAWNLVLREEHCPYQMCAPKHRLRKPESQNREDNDKTSICYHVPGEELPLSSFLGSSFYRGSDSLGGSQTLYWEMSSSQSGSSHWGSLGQDALSGPQCLHLLSGWLGHWCPRSQWFAGAGLHLHLCAHLPNSMFKGITFFSLKLAGRGLSTPWKSANGIIQSSPTAGIKRLKVYQHSIAAVRARVLCVCLYGWAWNNMEVRGADPLRSRRSRYNFWFPKNFTTNSLLLIGSLNNGINN